MNNIKCLIVEDEPMAAQLLKTYIYRVPGLELAGICYDAFEAMEYFSKNKSDLLFLDINMPQMSGIDLASLLDKEQKIIFTTAYAEYALNSFDYLAVDYLLKPISFPRFVQAINKVKVFIQQAADIPHCASILLKSGRDIIKLVTENVLYIEGMKEYICIYTTTSKTVVYKRMKEMEQLLPKYFLRVHNSYIVNMQHVNKLANGELIINNTSIPISQSYKEKVLQYLENQLL